ILITAEPPGSNCPAGGEKIQVGVDTDDDGVLEPGEVEQTAYVCNGSSATTATTQFNDTTCDHTAAPDVTHGIFVDAVNGDDTSGSGDPGAPWKTIPYAVSIATELHRSEIYLAEGTYDASLELPAGSTLYVEGGWVHNGAAWHRDCAAGARAS